MRRVRDHRPLLLAAMAWLAALPVVLLHGPGSDTVSVAPEVHFAAVSVAALVAGAAAVALGEAADPVRPEITAARAFVTKVN